MADESNHERNPPPPKDGVRDEQQPDKVWYEGHLWNEKELKQYSQRAGVQSSPPPNAQMRPADASFCFCLALGRYRS